MGMADNVFELANLKRRIRELEEYNDGLEDRLMDLEDTTKRLENTYPQPTQVIKEKVIEKSNG